MTVPRGAHASRADAVVEAYSPLRYWGFRRYLRRALSRRFGAVRLLAARAADPAPGGPLVVVANHPGFWDPLVFYLVNEALLPGRRLFGPMDAAALGRHRVLSRLGIFGIEQASARGARRFLEVGTAVLAAPRAALWVTAQGEFADVRSRPVTLKPGVAHLVKRVPDVTVLPLALEYGFWNEPHPEAFVGCGGPVTLDPDASGDPRAVAVRIEAALTAAMDELAAAVVARDAACFRTLLTGRRGLGGSYDLWRRARAAVTGRGFDPAHDPDRLARESS